MVNPLVDGMHSEQRHVHLGAQVLKLSVTKTSTTVTLPQSTEL
jgi:hypothetical protein